MQTTTAVHGVSVQLEKIGEGKLGGPVYEVRVNGELAGTVERISSRLDAAWSAYNTDFKVVAHGRLTRHSALKTLLNERT